MAQNQQRDAIKALSPVWLASGNAEKFLYAIGLAYDLLLEKMNQGIKARMPGIGTQSALPAIGADRVITQGPTEPNAAYAARLQAASDAWQVAGSRKSVLEQVVAYLQSQNTAAVSWVPTAAIVGGNGTSSTWDTIYNTMPIGATPSHLLITPANWNWDGVYQPWRAWLILYFNPTYSTQSGTAASFNALTVTGATDVYPIVITTSTPHGMSGRFPVTIAGVGGNTAANGTWNGQFPATVTGASAFSIPATGNGVYTSGGTALTAFVTVTGLTGMTSSNLQQWLSISGAASSRNNGLFQIVSVPSATSAVIACPGLGALLPDANNGSFSWSVASYPIVGPGPVWGAPGALWGDANRSWGLNVSSSYIGSIRSLVQLWKSAGTYYPWMIVAFDGANGAAGSEFSPYSSAGSGNPNGTWATWATTSSGVSVAARVTTSPYDCFCDGTGLYQGCSVPNVT